MENTRASSHKTYLNKSKIPVILTKKLCLVESPIKLILKSTTPETPEPSLTVNNKVIHRRDLRSQSDTYGNQTKETLSNLIKNSAITFISPKEFINQIQSYSATQPPTRELKTRGSENIFNKKMKNSSGSNTPDLAQYNLKHKFRANKSLASYKNDRKIEVTGTQIPKLTKINYIQRNQNSDRSATSHANHLTDAIKTRKAYKSVVVYNNNHKYFRSTKQDNDLTKLASGSYYYFPSN